MRDERRERDTRRTDRRPRSGGPLQAALPAIVRWLESDRDLDDGQERDPALDRAFALLEERLAFVTQQREEAPRLLNELLRHPPDERPRLVTGDGAFQTLALCERLVERSFEEGFHSTARAVELAELAILLVGHLDAGIHGRGPIRDIEARAWAYLGNARRMGEDLTGAEQALAEAERLVRGGSGDPSEQARILDLKASLLSDQGSFATAAELLDEVIEIYGEIRDHHRQGRAMISKALCLGHEGWPETALELCRQGMALIEPDREPRLLLMARHNMAWFLNDCGRPEEALAALGEELGRFQDVWTRLRTRWLEGRIAVALGRVEPAIGAFLEVRRALTDQGLGYDAALVTLDLAALYLKTGRTADVRRLAEETLPIFLAQDVHREAIAALVVFKQAAEMEKLTPGLVREISAYLLRAQRNPDLRFETAH